MNVADVDRAGSKTMRILNVVSVLAAREGGGNAERTAQMTRALQLAGGACTVLTLDIGRPEDRRSQLGDARLILLPCLNRRLHVPRGGWRVIADAVRNADVIHLMGHWSLLAALVYVAARWQGVPYVVGPAGALPLFGRSLWFKRIYNALVGRRLIKHANSWIAITNAELAHFSAYGIAAERVTVIPNGVWEADLAQGDGEEFFRTARIPRGPIVLFMGRLNPIKGPDMLLEAFGTVAPQFPELRLVFAGPDEGMQAALEQRARALGLADRVFFCGFVGGRLKAAAYRAARLLVVPSRSEAMSIVAVEGGICATPVLMTDQCGLDVLRDVDDGLVVPASADGLAAGLAFALADPQRLARWGLAWQAMVRERYMWPRLGSMLKALLDATAAQARA